MGVLSPDLSEAQGDRFIFSNVNSLSTSIDIESIERTTETYSPMEDPALYYSLIA